MPTLVRISPAFLVGFILVGIIFPPFAGLVIGMYIPFYIIQSSLMEIVAKRVSNDYYVLHNLFDGGLQILMIQNFKYLSLFGTSGIPHVDYTISHYLHSLYTALPLGGVIGFFGTLHVGAHASFATGYLGVLFFGGIIPFLISLLCLGSACFMEYKEKKS